MTAPPETPSAVSWTPAGAAVFPSRTRLAIRLDDNPRYRGSVHDDETARRMGFRAALVPGAFLYGHVSRVAIEAWGLPWAERGVMGARFRRPVYNGDVVDMVAGPLTTDPSGALRAEVRIVDGAGEDLAVGHVGLPPGAPPVPSPGDWPMLPMPDPRPAVVAGGLEIGRRTFTTNAVLTEEDVRVSLSAFDERHPFYARHGVVHSGCLMRRAMFDVNGSFRFPSPVVLIACETQHLRTVRPGQRLATSGVVAAVYEKRGRHYVETDEVMTADGEAVARFRRTSIYADAT